MAGFIETVKIKVQTEMEKKSKATWASLQGDISKTTGLTAKLGVATKGVGKAIGATLATGGGAALVAAGKKVADLGVAYDKTAISVDRFADSTGMSVEQASRWVETAGDYGIKTDQLAKAFNRMNVELAKSPQDLEKYGVQLQLTSEGQIDASETLLDMIDALRQIEDPVVRSTAAIDMLGARGGQVLTLMANSTRDWRAELAGVSEQQVFTDEDVATAYRAKDAVDSMKDSWEALKLGIGELVAGPLASLLETLGTLVSALGKVGGALSSVRDKMIEVNPVALDSKTGFSGLSDVVDQLQHHFFVLTDAVGLTTDKSVENTEKTEEMTTAQGESEAQARETAAAQKALTDAINAQTDAVLAAWDSSVSLEEATARMNEVLKDSDKTSKQQADSVVKVAEAQVKQNQTAVEMTGATYSADQKQQDLIKTLNTLAKSTSPAVQKELQKVIDQLNKMPTSKNINVNVNTNYTTTGTPTSASAGIKAGKSSVTVNVRGWNGNRVALGRDVKAAIRAAERWSA